MRISDWSSDVCSSDLNLVNTAGLTLNFWDGDAGPKFNGAVNGGDGLWQAGSGNDNWTEVNGPVNVHYLDKSFAIFSATPGTVTVDEIGRASCRERECQYV